MKKYILDEVSPLVEQLVKENMFNLEDLQCSESSDRAGFDI